MTDEPSEPESPKPLARNLGEFFGHLFKAIRTDPSQPKASGKVKEVRREVEEEHRGDMILRRTTIEEIEIRPNSGQPDASDRTDLSVDMPKPSNEDN